MVLITVHFHTAHNLLQLTIDADVQVTLTAHGLEEFAVVTFTTLHQRGEDEDTMAGIVVEDHVEHLFFRVFHHLLASSVTVGLAGTGKEQTHVVVDFGGGADGGTGILIGGLLFDADDRRKTCDLIHIGTLHTSQEIAGIGRERLDITTLTLGKDRVEGE